RNSVCWLTGPKSLLTTESGGRSLVLLSRPALAICTNGGTSESCAWRAQKRGTLIAESNHADLERTLLFSLRGAFVSTLQAKAVLQLAKDNLAYYDHVLDISRTRFSAGDIAQIDLDRLELQRVQYESDLQAAGENLENAKIQLLTLLNSRTPLDEVDLIGPYDFGDQLMPRDDFRKIALDT